jgi:hypothetical protein
VNPFRRLRVTSSKIICRAAEARSLLQSVYDRFSEGFETADLKTAKAHLDSMQ